MTEPHLRTVEPSTIRIELSDLSEAGSMFTFDTVHAKTTGVSPDMVKLRGKLKIMINDQEVPGISLPGKDALLEYWFFAFHTMLYPRSINLFIDPLAYLEQALEKTIITHGFILENQKDNQVQFKVCFRNNKPVPGFEEVFLSKHQFTEALKAFELRLKELLLEMTSYEKAAIWWETKTSDLFELAGRDFMDLFTVGKTRVLAGKLIKKTYEDLLESPSGNGEEYYVEMDAMREQLSLLSESEVEKFFHKESITKSHWLRVRHYLIGLSKSKVTVNDLEKYLEREIQIEATLMKGILSKTEGMYKNEKRIFLAILKILT
jgi:hypothetical protein